MLWVLTQLAVVAYLLGCVWRANLRCHRLEGLVNAHSTDLSHLGNSYKSGPSWATPDYTFYRYTDESVRDFRDRVLSWYPAETRHKLSEGNFWDRWVICLDPPANSRKKLREVRSA